METKRLRKKGGPKQKGNEMSLLDDGTTGGDERECGVKGRWGRSIHFVMANIFFSSESRLAWPFIRSTFSSFSWRVDPGCLFWGVAIFRSHPGLAAAGQSPRVMLRAGEHGGAEAPRYGQRRLRVWWSPAQDRMLERKRKTVSASSRRRRRRGMPPALTDVCLTGGSSIAFLPLHDPRMPLPGPFLLILAPFPSTPF